MPKTKVSRMHMALAEDALHMCGTFSEPRGF